MRRMGRVIKLKADYLAQYKEMHAAVWPEVLAVLTRTNITNYTIFLKEPENWLFAYWEYVGENYAADMEEQARDPAMRRWWAFTDDMQEPLAPSSGQWWVEMEDVFHLD